MLVAWLQCRSRCLLHAGEAILPLDFAWLHATFILTVHGSLELEAATLASDALQRPASCASSVHGLQQGYT